MSIDLQKLQLKFDALFNDPNFISDFEQWLEARNARQNRGKPIVSGCTEYEDITDELSQFQRGLLISVPSNCPGGIMVGGKYDGDTWLRKWNSKTMQNGNDEDNIYRQTGEIFCRDTQYYIVYRPSQKGELV